MKVRELQTDAYRLIDNCEGAGTLTMEQAELRRLELDKIKQEPSK